MDLETLVAAVAAERRPEIDLSGAALRSGHQNAVLETRDGWILRFPRRSVNFEREVATLRALQGRLPARIPLVEWTGTHTRFAAYRRLSGHAFDLAAYQNAPRAQQDNLATSLARFLAAMHQSLTAEEVANLGIPDHQPGGPDSTRALDILPTNVRRVVDELISEADALRADRTRAAKPKVVLHNDFHFWNIVFAAPAGELSGVWDFSNVAMGDPSDDLRYLPTDTCDLMLRTAWQYERCTGTSIDLRAATLANRIEVVFDAMDEDRTTDLPDIISRWQDADNRRRAVGS